MEKVYSCEEVAERYKVKTETVWGWIRDRKLSALKIGKIYRVTENDIKVFEQSRKTI